MVGSVGVVFESSRVFSVDKLDITSCKIELWRREFDEIASTACLVASCVISGVGLSD